MQYFEIPLAPAPKERPRLAKNGKVFTPKKTKVAEHGIRSFLRRHNVKKIEGAVEIKCSFIFKRPTTVNRKDHTIRPDIDNLLKLLLDGIQDKFGAFEDDKVVTRIIADKQYGERNLIKLWIKQV